MRFRADITNTATFTGLISSLTPLSKVATLKLKSDYVHLIAVEDGQGIQVWSYVLVSSHGCERRAGRLGETRSSKVERELELGRGGGWHSHAWVDREDRCASICCSNPRPAAPCSPHASSPSHIPDAPPRVQSILPPQTLTPALTSPLPSSSSPSVKYQ